MTVPAGVPPCRGLAVAEPNEDDVYVLADDASAKARTSWKC